MSVALKLLALLFSIALAAKDAGKDWTSEVAVVRRVDCTKKQQVKMGDRVRIMLGTSADSGSIDPVRSMERVAHEFVVGRYRLPPVDKGVKGMCLGDRRDIFVEWDGVPGMVYQVELVNHTTRGGVVMAAAFLNSKPDL